MEISEDKLFELEATEGLHQDDVAMFIDQNDTLEGLVSDLKEYFKLTEDYYKERAEYVEIVKRAMEDGE
ncbi:hypothetical protein [Enterococcus sp. DIV0800]|uniref:hypothetical protein n=1 Tax=unclassified Enterococcus TaxID=2608891 RepID=UPI003D2FDC75